MGGMRARDVLPTETCGTFGERVRQRGLLWERCELEGTPDEVGRNNFDSSNLHNAFTRTPVKLTNRWRVEKPQFTSRASKVLQKLIIFSGRRNGVVVGRG